MFIATLVYAAIFLRLLGKKWESSHGLVAFTTATALWLGVALLAIAVLHRTNFLVTVLIAIAGLISFHTIFRRFSVMPPKKAFLPQHIYVVRFLLGAILVSSAVVAARLLGPVWGGVIGSFPAMLGSVLYFLAKSQGPQFLEGFLRRLPAGYISSLTFIVLVHETITRLPVVLSFVVSLSAAALCASALLFLGPNRATTRPSVARQKAS
jgi:hypothetical protein